MPALEVYIELDLKFFRVCLIEVWDCLNYELFGELRDIRGKPSIERETLHVLTLSENDKEVMVGSPQFLQNRLKTEVDQLMNKQVFTKAPKDENDWFSESQDSENVSNFSENLHCRRSAVYIKRQSDVSNSQEKENLPTSQCEMLHNQPKFDQIA